MEHYFIKSSTRTVSWIGVVLGHTLVGKNLVVCIIIDRAGRVPRKRIIHFKSKGATIRITQTHPEYKKCVEVMQHINPDWLNSTFPNWLTSYYSLPNHNIVWYY